MKFGSTAGAGVDRLKVLVYGVAGAGKTRLAATTGDLPGTFIISVEGGLLSLRGESIDCVEVDSIIDMRRLLTKLASTNKYRWVILDSISEIAEVCLTEEMGRTKDGRAAYGEMATAIKSMLRGFRDLPFHVVMIAKQERAQTESGAMLYGPSMPGKTLTQGIAYMFDEVFALRVSKSADGSTVRELQTQPDGVYDCKDRSGSLAAYEPPSLAAIAAKILGAVPATQAPNAGSSESADESDSNDNHETNEEAA